jgi:glycerophosphoryl diester phosphodiesterase
MIRRRIRRRIAFAVLACAVPALLSAYLLLRITNPGAPRFQYFTSIDQDVMVTAHRGGVNLWPENTVYAFHRALDLGVDAIEIDVRGTADGRLVLHHDETVDRTTDGTGAVDEMTLDQLRSLDAGYGWPYRLVELEPEIAGDAYQPPGPGARPPRRADDVERPYQGLGIRVPTLTEVLSEFPDVRLIVELKVSHPETVDRFIEVFREAGRADRTVLTSFHAEVTEAFRRRLPGYPISGATPHVRRFLILNRVGLAELFRPPVPTFLVPEYASGFHIVTESFNRSAERLGLHVEAWSVRRGNNPIVAVDDMRRLLGTGVDGIITDRPDLLMEILGR